MCAKLVRKIIGFFTRQTADKITEKLSQTIADQIAQKLTSLAPSDLALPSDIVVVPKGLRSFDEEDAKFFIHLLPGPHRDNGLPESIHLWKTRIEETDPEKTFRVGVIYGPSGCGKSSFVKAGLIPHLSAERVIAVYVEATATDTEERLLAALRKKCPFLSPKNSLRAALRRRDETPDGKKTLIVLDQFEQYLHSTPGDEQEGLVEALRECDGQRLQCVVMVRDDFITPVTRFTDRLAILLAADRNLALVDLFDKRHAKKVLALFGQAFDALPKSGKITDEQDAFLNEAISSLAEGDFVISVRLALFAEMVKAKDWTPATWRAIGGAQGVVTAFLEESFGANRAPPENHRHQVAAQEVLNALLPEGGTNIKGAIRSRGELLVKSRYARRPADFDELLEILDKRLRLITPAKPPTQALGDDRSEQSPVQERYYQLTHDYLVPSLREWLTQKQKETMRGRAQLRLAERSASWNAKPENRHLPAWWEYINIRLFTHRNRWTNPEKKMMRAAGRFQGVRGAMVLVALTLGLTLFGWSREAERLRNNLLRADDSGLPDSIEQIVPYQRWVASDLEAMIADPTSTKVEPCEQANAAAALLRFGRHANIWPLLKHTPDPTGRTHVIHRLGLSGADPQPLIERLDVEDDTSIRRAIILALGEFPASTFTADQQAKMVSTLLGLYQHDPDPGVHGSAEWVLREKCGKDGELEDVDKRLRESETQLKARGLEDKRRWYITGQGHTMSIMAADVFWMGSLDSEPNRSDCELRHRMRLGRTIAIASKKVTASQLQGFMTENAEDLQSFLRSYHFDSEKARRPAEVNWFIAAAYCNWLSKREGIPESEWCYPQIKASEFRGGMKLYPDYLRRTGYRLPTEAEWEFACRSGADTSYSFGECEVRLRNYGWYGENSADRSHPVASLKPNDFGLFDMHGNVGEWCQDRYRGEYVPGQGGKPADDLEDTENVLDDPGHDRVVRGGVFGAPSYCLRSAYRFATPPGHPQFFTGFRPARTCK